MQTLSLIHRLDLRLIGVSGGTITKQASESKSDVKSKLETMFGAQCGAQCGVQYGRN